MIALIVLAAALANVTFVVMLAERFGTEGGVHASAGELTSLQAPVRAAASASTVRPIGVPTPKISRKRGQSGFQNRIRMLKRRKRRCRST